MYFVSFVISSSISELLQIIIIDFRNPLRLTVKIFRLKLPEIDFCRRSKIPLACKHDFRVQFKNVRYLQNRFFSLLFDSIIYSDIGHNYTYNNHYDVPTLATIVQDKSIRIKLIWYEMSKMISSLIIEREREKVCKDDGHKCILTNSKLSLHFFKFFE